MKFIVRNMVSRNITVLNILSCWSAAHPRMIFILTLQSFPRVGVQNVKCPCFPPFLQGEQAVSSCDSPGEIIQVCTIQMVLCTSGLVFCRNYRGGLEALRCKGVSCQGLSFQLWDSSSLFSWSPDLENTEVQMSPLIRLAMATCISECCGLRAVERTMAWLSWFSGQWSQHSALWVLVVQHHVVWLVAPGVPQNKSQHSEIRARCLAHLSLPPLWLTRSNWEHKSLII